MPRSRHTLAPSPYLFGREREQGMLGDCLRDMLSGRGRLVLISGEAGIGKTSVAQMISRSARDEGATVLTSACYDLTRTPPYGPWVELFAGIDSQEVPPALPIVDDHKEFHTAASPDALFAEALDYLARLADRQPLVVVLEDMHWADHASLDLLRYVARQLGDLQLLVIVTYRDTELDRTHPLHQLLPALVRETQATRVRLRPLDDRAVTEWLRERYGLSGQDESTMVQYLNARSEGNPFFIDEILRTLEEEGLLVPGASGWRVHDLGQTPVPQLVQQLIDGRLARLDDDSRRLLEVASVIGHDVPVDVWRAAVPAETGDLSTAIARAIELHLLEESPRSATLRFTHALVREALYYGVRLPQRQRVHAAVGEALAGRPASDPDAVAFHLLEAGHPDAREWLMAAGERAQQLYAWRVAAERFESVLPLLGDDPESIRARGWLLYRIGLLLIYADPTRGILRLGDAERVAHLIHDPLLSAHARASQGLLRCLTGDVRRGRPQMQEGVEALDMLPAIVPQSRSATDQSPASLIDIENVQRGAFDLIGVSPDVNYQRGALIFWLAWSGRYADVIAIGEPYIQTLPVSNGESRDALGDALAGLGHAYAALGRPDESLDAFSRAREAYQQIEHHFKVGNTAIYELSEAYLPYRADNVLERQWLAEQAEAG